MKSIKIIVIIVALTIITGCTETELYCSDNSTLIGDICVYEDNQIANKKTIYYCLSGGTLKGNQCQYSYTYEPYIQIECPSYYREDIDRCKFTLSAMRKNCPIGYVEWFGDCYLQYVPISKILYHCFSGTLQGNKCIEYYNQPALERYEYYCNEGYVLYGNAICNKKIYTDPLEREVSIFD